MGSVNNNFDEKAAKVIGLGKSLALGEGGARLDVVHIFKAAVLVYPEELALYVHQTGGVWSNALLNSVTRPEEFDVQTDPMPMTSKLGAIVRELRGSTQIVTLEDLLKAILHDPSARVKALLDPAGVAGSRQNKARVSESYCSKRDWLAGLHSEWRIRRAAAQACGLKVGFGDESQCNEYSADSALDAALRIAIANRSKAEATSEELDPLALVADGLDEVQRTLCEGILIDELYGLDVHPVGGLSVRDLACMLSPESYPGNCRNVLDAVERLYERGFIDPGEYAKPLRLTGRIRLADDVLDQLIESLEHDAISAGEFSEMKRKLRHGVDWERKRFETGKVS